MLVEGQVSPVECSAMLVGMTVVSILLVDMGPSLVLIIAVVVAAIVDVSTCDIVVDTAMCD